MAQRQSFIRLTRRVIAPAPRDDAIPGQSHAVDDVRVSLGGAARGRVVQGMGGEGWWLGAVQMRGVRGSTQVGAGVLGDATQLPMCITAAVCTCTRQARTSSTATRRPLDTSQRHTVLSRPALNTVRPSELTFTAKMVLPPRRPPSTAWP